MGGFVSNGGFCFSLNSDFLNNITPLVLFIFLEHFGNENTMGQKCVNGKASMKNIIMIYVI